MARLATLLVLTALAATVAAVPAAAQDQQEKPKKEEKKPKRNPDVISFDEIEAVRNQVSNGMDIVQRLRPTFLRTRGATTMQKDVANATPKPMVVLDGSPHGELETLRQISAIAIKEIRYLSGTNASTKFGTDYGGGAILVTTR